MSLPSPHTEPRGFLLALFQDQALLVDRQLIQHRLFGIGLMLIVIYRPQGIFGDKREMTFVK